MTFRNQPRCLTPSHLTTNHMTSYHITSQHSTSHHHHGNKTSHHQTSLDHRERLKGRAQKNSVFVIALVGGLVIGKFFRGFIGSLPLKLPPPDAPELLLFADSDTVHIFAFQSTSRDQHLMRRPGHASVSRPAAVIMRSLSTSMH